MSYNLNLGVWNSIFAVPDIIVDKHLKLATDAQLKVLLYILRHTGEEISDEALTQNTGISAEEVANAIEYWIERGVLASTTASLTPAEKAEDAQIPAEQHTDTRSETKHHTAVSRARRPDSMFVSKLLQSDTNLAGLLEEAQSVFKKPLSPGDTATLVMLYDTFGLPCEVLAMLINYLAAINSANMRSVEKIGIRWSDEGILTVEDAEKEIERMTAAREAWGRVSAQLGIHNVGNPTKSQTEHADRWVNIWKFSDEMIVEAYERCVNTKGEYNIRYINGILQKWHDKGIKSLDALRAEETAGKKKSSARKTNPKGSVFSVEGASFDISQYEKQSLFDD